MLDVLGLSQIADGVYRALVATPGTDAATLCARLGLDEAALRGALDELAGASLVRRPGDDPAVLWPVRPEVAIGGLLEREQAELARRVAAIEAGRAALAELLAGYRKVRRSDHVEVLTSVDDVNERLATIAAECRTQVRTIDPIIVIPPERLRASRQHDLALIERGVRMRCIHLDGMRDDPPSWESVLEDRDLGIEVRLTSGTPTRMVLVDDTYAFVPLTRASQGVGALLLTAPGVLTALGALFDQVWRSASPLPQHASGTSQVSEQELALLRLWAKGATDEAAARTLRLPLSSIRRMSASLHARLGAHSRFQAGALALARGWLTAADVP